MAPRPTKKSPGSTTPQPPPRPALPVQARHPPPPGLPATAPRPTAVVGRVAELMGGKAVSQRTIAAKRRFPEPVARQALGVRHPWRPSPVSPAPGGGQGLEGGGPGGGDHRPDRGPAVPDRPATPADRRGRRDAPLLRPRGRAVAGAAGRRRARLFPHLLRLAQVVCAAIGRLYADAAYDSAEN